MFTVRWSFDTRMSEGVYHVFNSITGKVVLVTRSPVTAVAGMAQMNNGR